MSGAERESTPPEAGEGSREGRRNGRDEDQTLAYGGPDLPEGLGKKAKARAEATSGKPESENERPESAGSEAAETKEAKTEAAETGKAETGKAQTGKAQTGETETGEPETGEPETGEPETSPSKEATADEAPVTPTETQKIGQPSQTEHTEAANPQPSSDAPSETSEGSSSAETDEAAAANAAEEAATGPAEDTAGDEIKIRYFGMTDVGLVREHNEDNFTTLDVTESLRNFGHLSEDAHKAEMTVGERGAVFAVCDGMGGAAAGEVASQMAVDTVYEFFNHLSAARDRDHFARRIVASIEEAGNRIFSAAKMDRSRRGMGTTATVAGLVDKVLFVGQVGDSRAYVLRDKKLGQISKDQSLVNQLIEAGQLTEDEAEAFEHSNIILQALGTTEEVTVDLTFLELRKGDRLMMCSDGLSGLVHHDMMEEVLATTPDLKEACTRLIEMANVGGGHDNITVICADFHGGGLKAAEAEDNVLYQQYPLPPGPDEDRESLPPRDIRMKAGGPKPGADVKRGHDLEDTGAMTMPAARGADPPSRFGLIAVVLLICVLIAVVVFIVSASSSEPEEPPTPPRQTERLPDPEPVVPITPDIPATFEVYVDSDIEGELYIDGEAVGPLIEGQRITVDLEPGLHLFEARSGESLVVEETVPIGENGQTIDLRMPAGSEDVAPGDAVEVPNPDDVEEGGETGGRSEEERETRGQSMRSSSSSRPQSQGSSDDSPRERSRPATMMSTPMTSPREGPIPINPFL
ncbi:MAG: protein phosphatase 2C domain-containing protein [Myxococcota bacterium]